MIVNERENRHDRVVAAGMAMLTAARTPTNACVVDILECCLL